MKIFLLLIVFTLASFLVEAKTVLDSNKVVKIIIMNDNRLRPIADTKNYFWRSDRLSEVNFSGDLYFDLVQYRLTKCKEDTILNDFSIAAAIIFTEKNKSDTIYTDMFFRNFLIKDKSFVATDDFLQKMFGPLYLGFYKYMSKGDD